MATPDAADPLQKNTKTIRARYTTACHITTSRNQSPHPAPPLQAYASQHSTTDDDIPPHSPTTSHRDARRNNARRHLSRRWHTHTRHCVTSTTSSRKPTHGERRPLTKKYEDSHRARYTTACHITTSRNQSPRPSPPLQGYASQHSTTDDDIPPHSPTTSHRDARRTNARRHLSRRWHPW